MVLWQLPVQLNLSTRSTLVPPPPTLARDLSQGLLLIGAWRRSRVAMADDGSISFDGGSLRVAVAGGVGVRALQLRGGRSKDGRANV